MTLKKYSSETSRPKERLDEDERIIAGALAAARTRTLEREPLIHGLPEEEKIRRINELRPIMFGRRENGEAFHELNDFELALIEGEIKKYVQEKKLRVLEQTPDLSRLYGVIRRDLLTGREETSPRQFREASRQITSRVLKDVVENNELDKSKTVFLLPWRAGLAFGEGAAENGFSFFYHLGAKRNEETLKTEINYENIPAVIDSRNPGNNEGLKAIITDPMLATGNTMIDAVKRLKNLGIREENILIASVISAPEGVDHILSNFSQIKITVGAHDERLNSRGFIVPGLGDFGDKYFAGLGEPELQSWLHLGVLTRDSADALRGRIGRK